MKLSKRNKAVLILVLMDNQNTFEAQVAQIMTNRLNPCFNG